MRDHNRRRIRYATDQLRQDRRTAATVEQQGLEAEELQERLEGWRGARQEDGQTKKKMQDDSKDNLQGVKMRTPLFDLGGGFDVIWSIPFDAMHQMDKGVVSWLVEWLFMDRVGPGAAAMLREANSILTGSQVPSEHQRRPRPLSRDLKAKELKVKHILN